MSEGEWRVPTKPLTTRTFVTATDDAELQAIEITLNVLRDLPYDRREAVLAYLSQRIERDEKVRPAVCGTTTYATGGLIR
jgi:hypothetical protein